MKKFITFILLFNIKIFSTIQFDENLGFHDKNVTQNVTFNQAKRNKIQKIKKALPRKLLQYLKRNPNKQESLFIKRVIDINATRKVLGIECNGCAPSNWGRQALFYIATGKTEIVNEKLLNKNNKRLNNMYFSLLRNVNNLFKRKINHNINKIVNPMVYDKK